jgi:hypothetical protein
MRGDELHVLDVRWSVDVALRDRRVRKVVDVDERARERDRDDEPIEPKAPQQPQLREQGAGGG